MRLTTGPEYGYVIPSAEECLSYGDPDSPTTCSCDGECERVCFGLPLLNEEDDQ